MDVAQDFVVSTVLEGPAQRAGIPQILEGDRPVPGEPEVEEHKILSDYWSCRATEIKRERIFNGTEIMEFENEVLREQLLRTPDNPTDANLGETKLMSGGVDGHNPGNLEIPLQLGCREWGYETTRGCVDVNRNGYPGLFLVLVQKFGHLLTGS